jgi:hypothetical protein
VCGEPTRWRTKDLYEEKLKVQKEQLLLKLLHASAVAQGYFVWAMNGFNGREHFSRTNQLKTPWQWLKCDGTVRNAVLPALDFC